MDDLRQTSAYWNRVFSDRQTFDPMEPLPYPVLEDALRWLADSHDVLDFGCGRGRALLRALVLGAERGVGIDISEEAIATAHAVVREHRLAIRCQFSCGSIDLLQNMATSTFDGALLFNILDNLAPRQGIAVLNEVHRLLRPESRVLIKLNAHLEQADLHHHVQLEKDLYRSESGLLFWNLSTSRLLEITQAQYALQKAVDVLIPDFDLFNRLFYFVTI